MLLTRDKFREGVFERDNHKCVICQAPAQDAHHIIERRLFPDGGYYLDNGSSLCGDCHYKAEQTVITPQEIRELGHWRWDVENNGFKALNQTVITKRIYSHDPVGQQAVLLILFTIFNLLGLFLSRNWSMLVDFLGVEPTRQLAIELLRYFLIALAYLEFR